MGRCVICQEVMAPPCIDRDHQTDEIRGLLCGRCNLALGCVGENVEVLQGMIEYLQTHVATEAQYTNN